MKTEDELNAKILKKTVEIQETFPELYIFLDEMQVYADVSYSTEAAGHCSNLKAYYDSLEAMLASYRRNVQNM